MFGWRRTVPNKVYRNQRYIFNITFHLTGFFMHEQSNYFKSNYFKTYHDKDQLWRGSHKDIPNHHQRGRQYCFREHELIARAWKCRKCTCPHQHVWFGTGCDKYIALPRFVSCEQEVKKIRFTLTMITIENYWKLLMVTTLLDKLNMSWRWYQFIALHHRKAN